MAAREPQRAPGLRRLRVASDAQKTICTIEQRYTSKNPKSTCALRKQTQAAAQPRGPRRDSCKRDAGTRITSATTPRLVTSSHTGANRAMAALTTTRKIEAVVHTKIDAARRRTVAKTIALDRLSAFLGDAAPALQPPALPWVDLEIRPAFREPVEICVDCPEKATESTAFKVRFPRLVRCLRLVCLMASSGRRRVDGVQRPRRVPSMASSSRDASRVFGGDASTGVFLDVMFWMIESQSHEVAKTHAERGTKKTGKQHRS